MSPGRTNVEERVSVEDYLEMRRRALLAEEKVAERDRWLFGLVPVASTFASARRAIEGLVEDALAKNREGR